MTAKLVSLSESCPSEGIRVSPKLYEMVRHTFANIGKPGFRHVLGEVEALRGMSVLLRKDHRRAESGVATVQGTPWQHIAGAYDFRELSKLEMRPTQIVTVCMEARRKATLEMLPLLEEAFWSQTTNGDDPERWDLVVLDGWFMHETIQHDTDGKLVAYLDSTFAFDLCPTR